MGGLPWGSEFVGREPVLHRVADAEDVHHVAVDGEEDAVGRAAAAVYQLADRASEVYRFVGQRVSLRVLLQPLHEVIEPGAPPCRKRLVILSKQTTAMAMSTL